MVEIPIKNDGEDNLESVGEVTDKKQQELSDELAATRAELEETKDKLLRLAADFENYKRQALRRESESKERAAKIILTDLLPVLDNFERAVHASSSSQDVQNLRIGVEFILQQLHEVLRSHGVEPIEATGQKFDPQLHEAQEEVLSEEHESGTVLDETQRGYRYKGQVLRPTMVKVSSK
ncbi:MAG: nucleotide exchange factor GrpE [Abditibacteriaceae bacterium]